MALSYDLDSRLKALAPVLDEHAAWMRAVMVQLFYPDNSLPPTPEGRPELGDLNRIYEELHRAGEGLMREGKIPDRKIFEAFLELADEFIMQLRRMEKDALLAGSGIDALTGLRSAQAMEKDLERELERRARQGKPFCLVLAHIDDFGKITTGVPGQQTQEILKSIAAHVRKCLRSFDDAYRLDNGEFVMALKQTETAGGTAAINRLRGFMTKEPVLLGAFPVTLSYCAAEPVPGDKMDQLLAHMRQDLNRYDEGGNTTIEYIEQSPLERFIHGMDDKGKSP